MPRSRLWNMILALMLTAAVQLLMGAVSQNATLFSFLTYAQSGRPVIPADTTAPTAADSPTRPNFTPPTQTTQPSQDADAPQDAVLSFSPGDLSLIDIAYRCEQRPDLNGLLCDATVPDLTGPGPTVLILHTHTTEAYSDTWDRTNYRSLDDEKNMLAIGDEVARVLELGGIQVIHDRTLHDYPDYDTAYSAARQTIGAYLKQYPGIQMVLDLHRDASDTGNGQLVTAATVGGQKAAQLMMVCGSGFSGWEGNFSLALKLSVLLEQENPGITRPISLRAKQYNLDLTAGSLLVEVGAAGNTMDEALIAANALAQAILTLTKG